MKIPIFSAPLLLLLLFVTRGWAAATPASSPASDPRNFANGSLIPDEDYCDQPRIVVTRDGTWVCVLTTSSGNEGAGGQHVAATHSTDQGKTWSPLVDLESAQDPHKSSYALALITPQERIFAFYCYNGDGINKLPDGKLIRDDMQGWFAYRYSEDAGRTWSRRYRLPMRLTAVDRHNDWQGTLQMFWATGTPAMWGGSVGFGFTKLGRYLLQEGEGWFYRSDNALSETDSDKIDWQLLPEGDHGVRAPEFGSVQEEFDVVHLEGQELFCVYRTALGHAACAYSHNGGQAWDPPEPLRYTPGGRMMKQPRACVKIWKTPSGRYWLWYHNNGTTTYNNGPNAGSRNLAWLCRGLLKAGRLHWSQPEIVAYVDGGLEGCSYPDWIEDHNRSYIVATQKSEARVLEVDPVLLQALESQATHQVVSTNGLVLDLDAEACAARATVPSPQLPSLCVFTRERSLALNGRGGFAVEVRLRLADLAAHQVLLDTRTTGGVGWALSTTDRATVRFDMCDGWRAAFWECDTGLLKTNADHHLVVIVDGGPQVISFVVDGELGDGGQDRSFGYGRFEAAFKEVNGARALKIAPRLHGQISRVRLYNRAVFTSEAVGNYRAATRP